MHVYSPNSTGWLEIVYFATKLKTPFSLKNTATFFQKFEKEDIHQQELKLKAMIFKILN